MNKPTDLKDLMLADYKYYGDWLERNEESGDKRVNLYITLLMAILAGVAAISDKTGNDILKDRGMQLALTFALMSLLPFGIFVFLRLIW